MGCGASAGHAKVSSAEASALVGKEPSSTASGARPRKTDFIDDGSDDDEALTRLPGHLGAPGRPAPVPDRRRSLEESPGVSEPDPLPPRKAVEDELTDRTQSTGAGDSPSSDKPSTGKQSPADRDQSRRQVLMRPRVLGPRATSTCRRFSCASRTRSAAKRCSRRRACRAMMRSCRRCCFAVLAAAASCRTKFCSTPPATA